MFIEFTAFGYRRNTNFGDKTEGSYTGGTDSTCFNLEKVIFYGGFDDLILSK